MLVVVARGALVARRARRGYRSEQAVPGRASYGVVPLVAFPAAYKRQKAKAFLSKAADMAAAHRGHRQSDVLIGVDGVSPRLPQFCGMRPAREEV